MPQSWLHGPAPAGADIHDIPDTPDIPDQGVVLSPAQPSPLISPCKSLPSLHIKERVDREGREAREGQFTVSMDTLYHGEDSELDFMESFLDYDSISIISPHTRDSEGEEREVEKGLEDPPVVQGTERGRGGVRERLRWLASLGKVRLRSLGSTGSLASKQGVLRKSREALGGLGSRKETLGGMRGSRETLGGLKRGLAKSRERLAAVLSPKPCPAALGPLSVSRIQSYQIPVLETDRAGATLEAERVSRAEVATRAEAARALKNLELLEKAVAKDSVREVLSSKRGMSSISEEEDLAFSNLVYTEVDNGQAPASGPASALYENVSHEAQYENVQEDNNKYQNIPEPSQPTVNYQNVDRTGNNFRTEEQRTKLEQNVYENVESKEPQEHYENYDFGENGIYQNILFQRKTDSLLASNSDVYSQVKTLKEAVHGVNDILEKDSKKENSSSKDTNLEYDTVEAKDENTAPLEDIKTKGKVSSLKDIFTFTPANRKAKDSSKTPESSAKDVTSASVPPGQGATPTSLPSNPPPTGTPLTSLPPICLPPSSTIFREWALSRTEQPASNKDKRTNGLFTSTERQIVAKFLENVKTELSTV